MQTVSSETDTQALSNYIINYDVSRFSFVDHHIIVDLEQFKKNYFLDWNELITEYLQVGIGDVPHFASQYVFARALHTQRTTERREMQTMYLEIVAGVNKLIEMGDLPLSR